MIQAKQPNSIKESIHQTSHQTHQITSYSPIMTTYSQTIKHKYVKVNTNEKIYMRKLKIR